MGRGECRKGNLSHSFLLFFFSLRSWQSCRASSLGTHRAQERFYAGRKGISKMILSINYQWKPLICHDRGRFRGLNFARKLLHLSKICHCCIWYLLPFCKSRILKSAPVMTPCSIFSVPLKCLLMKFLMWGAFLNTQNRRVWVVWRLPVETHVPRRVLKLCKLS